MHLLHRRSKSELIVIVSLDVAAVSEMQATNGEPTEMSPSERVMQMEEEEKQELEEKKRRRDPPIVFKDSVDVKSEYEALTNLLEGKLNEEERVCMQELRQYVLENEGSWALGDNFLNFVGESVYNYTACFTSGLMILYESKRKSKKKNTILAMEASFSRKLISNFGVARLRQSARFDSLV